MPAVATKPSTTIRFADLSRRYRRGRDPSDLVPNQGEWSEEEYLDLDEGCLLEFTEGNIEVLPMPSATHQRLVLWLCGEMSSFVTSHCLGEVLFAPLPVRIGSAKYREPDIALLANEHEEWDEDKFWDGADLVVEVVSDDDPKRDLVQKRKEYARAGIDEYWIVQPRESLVSVLNLKVRSYQERRFQLGDVATSQRLTEFRVSVSELFNAGRSPRVKRKNGKRS
ncbi:MAG: Uma2 family endonuclease [Planctomycetaceae bacterium]